MKRSDMIAGLVAAILTVVVIIFVLIFFVDQMRGCVPYWLSPVVGVC
jgi:hypothetical protein